MTWRELLDPDNWPLVERDLQDIGVDVGDRHLMRNRSWRWGETRIQGLLDRPATGYIRIDLDAEHFRMQPIRANRIQTALYGQH